MSELTQEEFDFLKEIHEANGRNLHIIYSKFKPPDYVLKMYQESNVVLVTDVPPASVRKASEEVQNYCSRDLITHCSMSLDDGTWCWRLTESGLKALRDKGYKY